MMRHVMQHTSPRRSGLVWLLLMPAFLIPALFTSATRAQNLAFPDNATTEQMMADQLVAMAWIIFGSESEPRPDQLQRANILLDMAAELNPDDEGMWQLRLSLAKAMEDQPLLIDSLRNYLRLQPKDDVAWLEFIKARLGSVESLDDYLESLERILRAESAKALSAPLRSRLATLAAQASQEIGDSRRSAQWLSYAVKLDQANPEAAAMVYAMVVEREGTPRQQGTALVNMLKASPVDPNIRMALATLLMEQGVYAQAVDQFEVAMDLVDMQTRLSLMNQYTLCLIATGRENKVPALLLDLQIFLKQMQAAEDPDLAEELDPEEAQARMLDDLPQLPPTLEFVQLVLQHQDNPVAAKESFLRLRDFTSQLQDEQEQQDSFGELVWVAAVFGQDPAWVKQRINLLDSDDEKAQLARGWLAFHQGDFDTAKELFLALGEDSMFARLGLASLPELNDEQRAEAYQQMIWDDSASMASIIAANRLHSLGKIINATGDGVSVRVLANNLSRQLWTPALTVSPWVRLKLRVTPGSFGYLQPMKGHVTIRNATRVPLSVGPGGAIQSLLMVMCSPTIKNEPMGSLQPTFFNMGRKLTLQPGSAIEADIRLDRFSMGQLVSLYPNVTITYSATAILDPRPLPTGGVVPGPLGATHQVGSLQARGLPATPNNLQLWIKDLDGTDTAVRATAISRLLVNARQPAETTEAQDFRAKINDLISQRYPDSFTPLLKAWTVRFMLPDEDGEPVSRRIIDLAQRSDDPMVRIIFLVMNADSPDSPALTDAIRHDDPTIRAFAQAMKSGLEKEAELAAQAENQTDSHQGDNDTDQDHSSGSIPPFQPTDPLGGTPSLDDPWLP
jgi:tetratricopeptide (TPR) repeat protein